MVVDPSPFRGDAIGMHGLNGPEFGDGSVGSSVEESVAPEEAPPDDKSAVDEKDNEVNGRGQTRADVQSMLQVIINLTLTFYRNLSPYMISTLEREAEP